MAAKRVDTELGQIWSMLSPLLITKRDAFFKAMAEYELTPPHGMALLMLVDAPTRMRDIADHMGCDASYVTAIVDNLERLGLAVRQPSATDRRVKAIALTPPGRKVAVDLQKRMAAPPAPLRKLSASDRSTLRAILAKLEVDETDSMWPRVRGPVV